MKSLQTPPLADTSGREKPDNAVSYPVDGEIAIGVEDSERELALAKFEECLDQMPLAGFGKGFNDQWLPRAVGYAKRAGLTPEAAIERISETQGGAGRNTDAEINSTVERIYAKDGECGHKKPKWPAADARLIESVSQSGATVETLKNSSPVKGFETYSPSQFLKVLFPGDPLVTVGRKTSETNYEAETHPLSGFSEHILSQRELVVPSPAIKQQGLTKDGVPSKHCAEMFRYRQYLVTEFDTATKDAAAAIIRNLRTYAPLVMALDSGGKSLHGWFDCTAASDEEQQRFFRHAVSLGADPAMWKTFQFARLPHGKRFKTGVRQNVLYWEPAAIGGKWHCDQLPGIARAFSIMQIPEESATEGNLLGDRYLTVGKALALIGQTGVGKSSLLLQAFMLWALGKPFFGIKPAKPLKCLLVQAENDEAELREERNGIIAGLNLEEHTSTLDQNVLCCTLNVSGDEFFKELDRLLQLHKPDIVGIDPLFAFLGVAVSDQQEMSAFLRTKLQPLLEKHQVGAVVSHHVNKPASSKKDRAEWSDFEFAYAGSGSAEIANWFRAIMVLRRTENPEAFELILAKRHKQAGLLDDAGNPVRKILVRHSTTGLIFWEPATEVDTQAPDYQERLEELFDAFETVAVDGEAKKSAVAKALGKTPRTLDRLFQDKDHLLILVPGRPEPVKLVRRGGVIAKVGMKGQTVSFVRPRV